MRNVIFVAVLGALAAAAWAVDFSNVPDKASDGVGGLVGPAPGTVLVTAPPDAAGPPYPSNGGTLGGTVDLDALASEHDLRSIDGLPPPPPSVVLGDLLLSLTADPAGNAVYYEYSAGGVGVLWTQTDFCNPAAGNLDDVDGLQIGSPTLYYSETGDPNGISVWADVFGTPTAYVTHAQIVTAVQALGYTGPVNAIDVDALMVADSLAWGLWDALDMILFSIRDTRPAGGSFDGGELVVLDGAGTTAFLVHGGHTWDTAFDVAGTFGVATEEVDAIERGRVCRGDFNGDGHIDFTDLASLLANYGTPSGAAYEEGDADEDGDVDFSDLAVLLAGYNTTCP